MSEGNGQSGSGNGAPEDIKLDEVMREFLSESRENLEDFENVLLESERKVGDSRENLDRLFRCIHSIKGSSAFLQLAKLEEVAHVGETLLGRLRDGRLLLSDRVISALLQLVDVIRRLLDQIEQTGSEDGVQTQEVVRELQLVSQVDDDAVDGDADEETSAKDASVATRAMPLGGGKIRVDVHLLDKLMNLVGELVLARNQVVQLGESDAALGRRDSTVVQRLNLVTTELQETAMKTRMQPLSTVFSRFPRIVRDVAKATGKSVNLQMQGRETELDKSIIEAIQDPLTHLVRNAVDHGIESRDERKKRGKPSEGQLILLGYHEGGMVNIEIHDDGAGIDVAQVKRRAIERGLCTPERVDQLSERETLDFLFSPGFSTAREVTTVSGRGVGMDIVRTKIEQIGGTVDIQTRQGEGTTIKIKIPLTLAIIPALVVSCERTRYAIPQASVLEVVRLDDEDDSLGVEEVQGAPVYRLREKLLPVAYLSRELGLESAARAEGTALVVLQADDRSFGLVVDEVHDTEEIVVKPLWKHLKGLSIYAGATVMGDGRVALILDALGLEQRVTVVTEDAKPRTKSLEEQAVAELKQDQELLLLCEQGQDGRLAIPLTNVARLEEVEPRHVERVGGKTAMQYRGEILPLMELADVLEERRAVPRDAETKTPERRDSIPVVVFGDAGRHFGLMVDGILDILEIKLAVQQRATRRGVLGTMVIQDRITEVLDVEATLERASIRPKARPSARGLA